MDKKVIMPFHLFTHHGRRYVLDVEAMRAGTIGEEIAAASEIAAAEPDTPPASGVAGNLKRGPVPITTMALFLTQSCNLNCIYCYGEGGEFGSGGSMEEKTALQAVDWLIEQSGEAVKLNIVFFGGEPFLNFPLMKKVMQYTQLRVSELGKRAAFHVTTNGTLLSDEVISFLKKYQVNVMISIDGPREIQDRQRPFANGKGTYDAIVPKIKKLLAVLPETRGHAVIADGTDPVMVKQALKKIGFSKITTAIMSGSLFDEESCKRNPFGDMSSILDMMEVEAEAWISHTKNKETNALIDLILNGHLAEGIVLIMHHLKKRYPCKAGLEFAGVSCAGDVYPCQRFNGLDNYKLGNIFSKDLDRDLYHKPPRTYIKKCAGCFARYYCAGGCKYMNAVSGNSISIPSEDFCRLKRRELELSAYIYCTLDQQDLTFLLDHDILPPKPCPLDF